MEQRAGRQIPLPWLLAPVVALSIAGLVTDVFGPKLINDHPLVQMFFNPRNRYLLLAAPKIDVVPYFVVGFIRLVLTDPIAYVIGWQYGDAAARWIEKQMGDTNGIVRWIERTFAKIGPLVILIAPSFNWCVLAGATRMRPRLFITLNLVGTVGRLVLFRIAADAWRDELESVLEFIQRYQWPLVGVSLVAVILTVSFRGGSPVESPTELAAELEAEVPDE